MIFSITNKATSVVRMHTGTHRKHTIGLLFMWELYNLDFLLKRT